MKNKTKTVKVEKSKFTREACNIVSLFTNATVA